MLASVSVVKPRKPAIGVDSGDGPGASSRQLRHSGGRWHVFLAWAALFLFSVARRPPGAFVHDADGYWTVSLSLFAGDSMYGSGLSLRGVLTSFVYAPAALAEQIVHGSGRWAILTENGLMIALAGAVLLPGIARAAGGPRAQSPVVIWVCAGLTWLVLGRFAPYPLMDIAAALLFLTVLRLVMTRERWWMLVVAGVAAGVAFNLRPAYLIAIAAVVTGAAVLYRWRTGLLLAGIVLGSLPQVVYNLYHGSALGLTPPGTASLVGLQASYASYIVRYDTIIDATGAPQQFYCDPGMARAIAGHPVTSTGGLAKALLANPFESIAFLLKKVCAALAWSVNTPYSAAAAVERYDFALPIVLITVAGAFGVVVAARRREGIVLAGVGSAICVSLMTSATETRFALPLILLGIVGCALVARLPAARLRSAALLCTAAGTVLLVLAFAAWGLVEDLPPGPSSVEMCLATQAMSQLDGR